MSYPYGVFFYSCALSATRILFTFDLKKHTFSLYFIPKKKSRNNMETDSFPLRNRKNYIIIDTVVFF